jgi:hypothetical protein
VGPITLLRAFGKLVFRRQVSCWIVAPPWLVYSELMNADDPSANEARLGTATGVSAPSEFCCGHGNGVPHSGCGAYYVVTGHLGTAAWSLWAANLLFAIN